MFLFFKDSVNRHNLSGDLNSTFGELANESEQMVKFNSDPDEKFMQHINKFKNAFHKRFCSWNCPIWFKNMQSFLQIIVHAKAFEIFIVLCIIINTIFLAADHHDADDNLKNALSIGNSGLYTKIKCNNQLIIYLNLLGAAKC